MPPGNTKNAINSEDEAEEINEYFHYKIFEILKANNLD